MKYSTLDVLQKKRKTVCKLVHKAGLSVPYDRKNDLGYRPVIENEKEFKILLFNNHIPYDVLIERLQPLITAANIGNI